jgi:hypothetical protein
VRNLEARLAKHPEEADLHYQLGRAHALAFVSKRDRIRGNGEPDDFRPLPPDCRDVDFGRRNDGHAISDDEAVKHLRQAVEHFGRAIKLKRSPRYYLALASVLETAGERRVELDPRSVLPDARGDDPQEDVYVVNILEKNAEQVTRARALGGTHDPAGPGFFERDTVLTLWNARNDQNDNRKKAVRGVLADFWLDQTIDAYFIAYSLAQAVEAKFDDRPMGSAGLRISVEAGEGFLRVAKPKPDPKDKGSRAAADSTRITIVETAVRELSKQQQNGGITPIVLSLQPTTLSQLQLPRARVNFNLDGTGLSQQWTWLRPQCGILVWDPNHTGRITSGRQLFGSVSWWIFFDNGYQALDALDDNRDGQLSGSELEGLAVWFDRNGNGVSDPGEVIPVDQLGIAAISCRATSTQEGCPANLEGLTMTDGRVLPTYDWIAKPAAERSHPAFAALPALATLTTITFFATPRRRVSRRLVRNPRSDWR